jgi:hypothetical protein
VSVIFLSHSFYAVSRSGGVRRDQCRLTYFFGAENCLAARRYGIVDEIALPDRTPFVANARSSHFRHRLAAWPAQGPIFCARRQALGGSPTKRLNVEVKWA